MTTTENALWTDTNGSMICTRHAGSYLSGAIASRPKAKKHTTPITTWTLTDRAAVVAEFEACGLPASAADCEECWA